MPQPSTIDRLLAVAAATWIYSEAIAREDQSLDLYRAIAAFRRTRGTELTRAQAHHFVAALQAAIAEADAGNGRGWLDRDACQRVIDWLRRQEVAA